jgi:hypothetical protein
MKASRAEILSRAHDALLDRAGAYAQAQGPGGSEARAELLLALAEAAIVWKRAEQAALSRRQP